MTVCRSTGGSSTSVAAGNPGEVFGEGDAAASSDMSAREAAAPTKEGPTERGEDQTKNAAASKRPALRAPIMARPPPRHGA